MSRTKATKGFTPDGVKPGGMGIGKTAAMVAGGAGLLWFLADDDAAEKVGEKGMDVIWSLLEGLTGLSRDTIKHATSGLSVCLSCCCMLFVMFKLYSTFGG